MIFKMVLRQVPREVWVILILPATQTLQPLLIKAEAPSTSATG
jgi:hypothetical protein